MGTTLKGTCSSRKGFKSIVLAICLLTDAEHRSGFLSSPSVSCLATMAHGILIVFTEISLRMDASIVSADNEQMYYIKWRYSYLSSVDDLQKLVRS